MGWTVRPTKAIQKVIDDRNNVIREEIILLWRDVTIGSPVDTGLFRANWQFAEGSKPEGALDSLTLPGNPSIPKQLIGKVFYIANNLPYGYRLEYEGWSDQAPNGWVRTAIIDTKNRLDKRK